MELMIKHVATGRYLTLKGFYLTEYQDNLETKYNSENVYGRMDPIVTYQGTSRKIDLGILYEESKLGMDEVKSFVNHIMRFQYPVYTKYRDSNALAISRPPLVLVQFADWIRGEKEVSFDQEGNTFQPLLCAMNNFGFTPAVGFTPLDSPFIEYGAGGDLGATQATANNITTITPTNLSMKFNLTVLHTEHLGFDDEGKWTGGESWGPGDSNTAYGEESKQPKFNEASISPEKVNSTPDQSNAASDQDKADQNAAGIP
jgi:hypothetical protein